MKCALAICLTARAFACQMVEGDRILGKDLAAANPVFAALDPNHVMGPSPLAGVERVFRREELGKLARQYEIAAPAPLGDLCFERVREPLTAEKLLPVLRSALASDDVNIEILDYGRYPVPPGALEFTRAGLSPAGLWRGHVAYAGGRTAPVWAKVRVTAERTWIEAAQPLVAGKAVETGQLVERKGPRFPFGPMPLDSVDLAAGREPIRAIQPGVPIFASMLQAPREVNRGDKVAVEVSSGAALVAFEAIAESSGRLGESIVIRNPAGGRYFRARIEGKGKVSVKE